MKNDSKTRVLRKQTPTPNAVAPLAILAMAGGWATQASAQSTPNWGASTSAPQSVPAATQPAVHRTSARHQPVAIPPELATLLARPDTDVVKLDHGKTRTVRELRAQVHRRQTFSDALNDGAVPPGRQTVRVATARSPQHDTLLNASKLLRDTARREAAGGSAPTSADTHPEPPPSAISWGATTGTAGARITQGDPAAAWSTTGSSSAARASRRPATISSVPVAAPPMLAKSDSRLGTARLPGGQPSSTEVSQSPAAIAIAHNLAPGIALVNGRSKNIQFTPGGLYKIIGTSLGETVGDVALIGQHLPGGRITLQVTQWGDREVLAQLAEPMNGITDQPVKLQVTTRAGVLYTMDVQFYATRQSITLTDDLDVAQAFEFNFGNPSEWSAVARGDQVTRSKSGNDIGCPNPGRDTLRTKLPPGWAVVEVAINSWLPTQGTPNKDLFGDDGDTVVSGRYSITQIPAGFTNQTYEVSWAVLRSHTTDGFKLVPKFSGNDLGWEGYDGCISNYSVSMTVVGPAGLRPF